jgi:hypothetical protein
MKLGNLTKVGIGFTQEKTKVRFDLGFDGQPRQVEFEVLPAHAMAIMRALQTFQARHKLPMPRPIVPAGGPILRVVTDDE